MSELAQLLQDRLKEQDLTKYAIAKAMAQADGQGKPATNYSNKVTKILEDPENRVFGGLKELVELLDGEIVIRWKTIKEHTLK